MHAAMGDANASIPTPQPVIQRPMFAAFGKGIAACSVTFISQAAEADRLAKELKLDKQLVAVKNCRQIGKANMKHNFATPDIAVDPETYQVTADGEILTCEPADILPMAQRYFLF